MDIENILNTRERSHGSFKEVAMIDQGLKEYLKISSNYSTGKLSPTQKLGIEMILHKLSRILSGNPNELDHYIDIIGYAQLIINHIEPRLDLKD